MTPAGTSIDVQNGWEENTHTHTTTVVELVSVQIARSVRICKYSASICACYHPIYYGHQTCGRTSRGHTGGRSHRISPPSFCGACLDFYREKDSVVPFPRRPLSRISCTHELTVNRSPLAVCVCVFSSHPFWTSSSLDVPAGVTQKEGHTGFLIHLLSAVRAFIFLAVKSNFVYYRFNRSPPVGHFYFCFSVF